MKIPQWAPFPCVLTKMLFFKKLLLFQRKHLSPLQSESPEQRPRKSAASSLQVLSCCFMTLRKPISKYSSYLMCTLWRLSRELAHIKHVNCVLSSSFKVYYLSSNITCVCMHVYEGREHVCAQAPVCLRMYRPESNLECHFFCGGGVTSFVQFSTG